MNMFQFGYAVRSLIRGGQRTALAILCIAFGVMALVAMQLLSSIVGDTMMLDPQLELGGDIRITTTGPLRSEHLARLDQLERDGIIREYTLFAPNREMSMFRREGSGRVQFLTRALGIDASTYPLAGELTLAEPAGATLRDVLRAPGDVIITEDVARKLGLGLGSAVRLGGRSGSAVTPLRIAGIATVVPDRRGDSMLYDTATARLIAGDGDFIGSASALLASEQAATAVEQAGFTVTRTGDVKPDSAGRLFNAMLKGAGILGLLIGGIGVANTLSVLLARRTLEIATLKAIGYRRRDLFMLFTIETALLGVVGSIIGAAGGLLVSSQLMKLLDRTEGAIMLVYRLDVRLLIGGVLVGIITAAAFGMYAIARAVAIRPAVLLRGGSVPAGRESRATLGLIALLVTLVFGTISAIIMGSLTRGAMVIMVAVAALAVLGPLFGALLFGILRLPLPGNLLNIARRNLQHQRARAIVAMIALFIGAFTIGFAAATMLGARDRVIARHGSDAGLNLNIYGRPADEPAIRAILARENITEFNLAYTLSAKITTSASKPLGFSTVEGRHFGSVWADATITAGRMAQRDDEAVLPAFAVSPPFNITTGETLTVGVGGTSRRVTIVGFYEATDAAAGLATNPLIISAAAAHALAGNKLAMTITAAVPIASLETATEAFSRAVPQAMVVSKADFNDLRARSFQSLFMFVAGLAGLALVAGAVLIANAVGLALVERKREIGILKAIGYTAGRVLTTILLENGLLGILAGLTGIIAVHVVMMVINNSLPQAELSMGSGTAIALLLASTGLALGAAVLVAWRPTRVRPLAVLRED